MTGEDRTKDEETIPFYPDQVRSELRVTIVVIVILFLIGLWGLALPLGLDEPADPMNTPAHVKPEWYFLGLYQLLKFIPKSAGVILPIIALAVLTLWPFIDRQPDTSHRIRHIRAIVTGIGLTTITALTVWGMVS